MPLVQLYASNHEIPNSEKSKRLKNSLSVILSKFYPFAGSIVGNLHVDCNDGGAPFFDAEANCDLSQVVSDRNHLVMDKFLPYKMEDSHDFCLVVQATYFRCGGLAIGTLLSHKIADGSDLFTFANAWAAAARDGESPLPKFDSAAYFPPQQQDTSGLERSWALTKEKLAVRTFTFPAAAISLLRERYSGGGERPSPVVALSAFILTQFLSATCKIEIHSDPSKMYALSHAINLRSRVNPPLSRYHIGNMVGESIAILAVGDDGVEVVKKIREAVKRGHVDISEDVMKETTQMILFYLTFSSLCGYPLYEADYGWGTPVWVTLARCPIKNMVFFMDTKTGGGIEALIHLTQQDMVRFEAHISNFNFNKSNL